MTARAEIAPPYRELLRRSVERAPVLLEQEANLRAARSDARQARAWANPAVGVEFENIGGNSVNNSPSTPQTTLAITQPLELAQRGPRIAAGDAELRAAQARGAQVQVDYAAQLAIAYAQAEAMQQRLQLAQDDVVRAQEDLKAADALVAAGKEARLRSAQAQASLSGAIAARAAADANLSGALADLSVLAGVEQAFSGVPASLLSDMRAPMGPGEGVSPALATAQAERDAVAAQVRVERSKAIPDIGLTGGLRRFGGSRETGFVLGVTTTIPIFNQNRGGIAAAQARTEAAEQRLVAARLASEAMRGKALAQVAASSARLKAAAESEEAAAEAYRLARVGYESGKTALLDLLTLRRALGDARALTIDARLARIGALAMLARVDGRLAFGDL
ncbi:TolC family protein [Novosphingobium sediminicola]|uniref:Cobalt-zinc-cadmium efflux system outer membrane protein n=1 Tax=Novosphingobium sediminicola TaxID=563162 RepID=A0A7W6CFN4_9SPHN|nr:TolC family protein [Novosphingobium sediminicola]MBB3955683.1 cobalt-zinc-cadmium efflux system outer membrane protein [Novosphingobium sediminicola]